VNLENSYTNAIPVCTYNIASTTPVPAVVRIDNITATSFDVYLQKASNSATAETPGDVHCLISDEGEYMAGGLHWEARTKLSTFTSRRTAFGDATDDVTASITGTFTSPVVLHQVITSNDPAWSASWSYNGVSTDPPTAASVYVGKHVGADTVIARANETVGFILIETGSGTVNGVAYDAALGADTIDGVDNAGDTYTTPTMDYRHGIASQSAMDGGDGGWAVLYGVAPLAGSAIDIAIDEDDIEDAERSHTDEQVAYGLFEPLTVSDIGVSIDDGSATYTPGSMVVYTAVVSNAGVNDTSNASLVINEPAGTTISAWTCSSSGGANCANASGVGGINQTSSNLPVGGSLTFTINLDVPSGYSGNLVINASVATTNTDNNSSNDMASDTDTQSSLVDIEVNKDDGATTYIDGTTVSYTVSVTNNGPSDATNVLVSDSAPGGTAISSWSCTGASCPAASGAGNINETAATLVSGDSLVYSVNVDVPAGFTADLTNVASASPAETDSNPANNSDSDTNLFFGDSDGDGLLDTTETGPDPANPVDSDSDGIPDYLEPNNVDTDGDGAPNHADSDDDGDGIPSLDELGNGGALNPADSDGDGVPDYLSAAKLQTGLDGGAGSPGTSVFLIAMLIMMGRIITTGRHRHVHQGHIGIAAGREYSIR
jgi:uncharacterized repeat protein (TIGR01451 family)